MDEQFQDQEELTWKVVAGVFLAKISKTLTVAVAESVFDGEHEDVAPMTNFCRWSETKKKEIKKIERKRNPLGSATCANLLCC